MTPKPLQCQRITVEDMASLFMYEVAPENQCQGLKMSAHEQGHNKFVGVVQYSDHYKSFYLTTDGITYTALENAQNVRPIFK